MKEFIEEIQWGNASVAHVYSFKTKLNAYHSCKLIDINKFNRPMKMGGNSLSTFKYTHVFRTYILQYTYN